AMLILVPVVLPALPRPDGRGGDSQKARRVRVCVGGQLPRISAERIGGVLDHALIMFKEASRQARLYTRAVASAIPLVKALCENAPSQSQIAGQAREAPAFFTAPAEAAGYGGSG